MTNAHPGREPLIHDGVPAPYKQAFRTVASEWEGKLPEYQAPAGSRQAYAEMRRLVASRMIDAGAPERVMKSLPNGSGLEVVGNFFYTGAAKAALIGYSMADLHGALYQPLSFRQIVTLTKESRVAARSMEVDLGLADYGYTDTDAYTLSADGLVVNQNVMIEAAKNGRDKALRDADYNGTELPKYDGKIRCKGMQAGLVTYAYRYMLDICMVDPALFRATIGEPTDQPETA